MKALAVLKDIYDTNSGKKSKFVMTFRERMKFVKEAIEELESLQNRKCENCKHYSTGKQPDGFGWHKCEYNFECKTCFNDYFEAK